MKMIARKISCELTPRNIFDVFQGHGTDPHEWVMLCYLLWAKLPWDFLHYNPSVNQAMLPP